MNKPYPIYNEDKPEKPGMYLGLFHGRSPKDVSLDDWGVNGPIIGPLNWAHTTYAGDVRVQFADHAEIEKYGMESEDELICEDGMLKFHNVWYGDWTVFHHNPKGQDANQ